jgi:hypothetical protein
MKFFGNSENISSQTLAVLPFGAHRRNGAAFVGLTPSKAAVSLHASRRRGALGDVQGLNPRSVDFIGTTAYRERRSESFFRREGRLLCEARTSRKQGYSDVLLSRSQLVNKPVITRTTGINLGVVSQARGLTVTSLISLMNEQVSLKNHVRSCLDSRW